LKVLSPNVRGVVGDEISMMLEQHDANIAVVWSGVAASIIQNNSDFDYIVPKEGPNLWFDNMVIPKTAQNEAVAHHSINFILNTKNRKQNIELVAYTTEKITSIELL